MTIILLPPPFEFLFLALQLSPHGLGEGCQLYTVLRTVSGTVDQLGRSVRASTTKVPTVRTLYYENFHNLFARSAPPSTLHPLRYGTQFAHLR